jgi:hypothetical protein
MLSWELLAGIAGAILTVLSIIAFFVKPLLKLNTSITTLTEAVKGLLKSVEKNDECHSQFTRELSDHEVRITVIEDWRKGVE